MVRSLLYRIAAKSPIPMSRAKDASAARKGQHAPLPSPDTRPRRSSHERGPEAGRPPPRSFQPDPAVRLGARRRQRARRLPRRRLRAPARGGRPPGPDRGRVHRRRHRRHPRRHRPRAPPRAAPDLLGRGGPAHLPGAGRGRAGPPALQRRPRRAGRDPLPPDHLPSPLPRPVVGPARGAGRRRALRPCALRDTLERLVDFDRLNRAEVRLTLACTDLETGEDVYFDNTREEIRPEHVLASAAIAPLFPPVEIGGRLLCDPGYANNLPLGAVFDPAPAED